MIPRLFAASLTCMLLMPQAGHAAAMYSFTDLGALGMTRANGINAAGQVVGVGHSGAAMFSQGKVTGLGSNNQSQAFAINDAGQAVGYITPEAHERATMFSGGALHDLGALGPLSQAVSINNLGQAVGFSWAATPTANATLFADGKVTYLGTLGGEWGQATDINNASQIAGYSTNGLGVLHATLFWNGDIIDLAPDWSGYASAAAALNDHGVAVGMVVTETHKFHAALFANGTVTVLSEDGFLSSGANDINNSGQIVGDHDRRATIWNQMQRVDLNTLVGKDVSDAGWLLTNARAINDKGSIIGEAFNSNTGRYTAFLLSPTEVPEPASSSLIFIGIGIFAASRLRRRVAKTIDA
jgi:probable HAF family extracellular repeat protein